MILIDILSWGLIAVGLILMTLAAVLLIEVVAAVSPSRSGWAPGARPASRPRIAVLVPAHDEALVIADTLRGIQRQLEPADRLVVVADNCTDATEEIARSLGAEVARRVDPDRRGKSHALAFGVRYLSSSPPEVMVVVDADCPLDAGCLEAIAARAQETGRPVQARYEMLPPSGKPAPLRLRIATFAFKLKNGLRASGLCRLGFPCHLAGTGMAFPWPALGRVELASGELAEDLVLGLDFARAGLAPLYDPSARVTSTFPASDEGTGTQRERWESGHLATIARHVPTHLVEAVRHRNLPLLVLAIDAAVPPLAFGGIVLAAAMVVSGLWALVAASYGPLALSAAATAMFAVAVGLAWYRAGRDILSVWDLMAAPAYAVSKLSLYARVLKGKRTAWIRSSRD